MSPEQEPPKSHDEAAQQAADAAERAYGSQQAQDLHQAEIRRRGSVVISPKEDNTRRLGEQGIRTNEN